MNRKWRLPIWIGSIILFLICTTSMFYFGYKTFYLKEEDTSINEYAYHFAMIGEEQDNVYWDMIYEGAKEAADEHNIYLDYIAPRIADNEESLTLLDRMISAKVDGIITHGIRGKQFVDLVHKGIERGIPIMTIDSDVESSERKAYVGSNNEKAGELIGDALRESNVSPQYIGVVTSRTDTISQVDRIKGLKKSIQDNTSIQIVAIETSDMTEVGAARATYTLLKEHPEITTLIGMSSQDGIGMVDGMKDIAVNRDIAIIAFDTLQETLEEMKAGQIDTIVQQQPDKMGIEAIDLMLELQSHDLIDNKRYTDTKLIYQKDVQKKYRDDTL